MGNESVEHETELEEALPRHLAEAPDLVECDDCGKAPCLTVAIENGEPIAVMACDCKITAAETMQVTSIPFAWL